MHAWARLGGLARGALDGDAPHEGLHVAPIGPARRRDEPLHAELERGCHLRGQREPLLRELLPRDLRGGGGAEVGEVDDVGDAALEPRVDLVSSK